MVTLFFIFRLVESEDDVACVGAEVEDIWVSRHVGEEVEGITNASARKGNEDEDALHLYNVSLHNK